VEGLVEDRLAGGAGALRGNQWGLHRTSQHSTALHCTDAPKRPDLEAVVRSRDLMRTGRWRAVRRFGRIARSCGSLDLAESCAVPVVGCCCSISANTVGAARAKDRRVQSTTAYARPFSGTATIAQTTRGTQPGECTTSLRAAIRARS
jgi:hypothetical protein